jgi:CSLREA domain-containing protein
MQARGHRLIRRGLVLALAAVALAPAAASADTFKVNKRGDANPGACTADHCTLREALFEAAVVDGDDTIVLPSTKPYAVKRDPSLPGPDEAAGDLDFFNTFGLGNDLVIKHPGGGRATIDADGLGDRAIEVGGTVTFKKIRVRGGAAGSDSEAGGGILVSDGVAILRRSVVVGNHAPDVGGGIAATAGSVILVRSAVKRNTAGAGGGMFVGVDGRVELDRSTIQRNEAQYQGGALYHDDGFGTSRIDNSTLAHNEAGDDGGAVYSEAEELRVVNSTFTKNKTAGRGGAIYSAPDTNALVNAATIARNRSDSDNTGAVDSGGGIYGDGGSDVIELKNSLVVKNRATDGGLNECDAPAPVGVASAGGNLITSEAGGCTYFDHPEDILAANPKIAKLQQAGGPTPTIPLKSGSPAINQADALGAPLLDQRGVERQNPDIGAYER